MSSEIEKLGEEMNQLKSVACQKMTAAGSTQELYQIKVDFWGKNGSLTQIQKSMTNLSKEERPLFGKTLNEVKESLETFYSEKEYNLKQLEMERKMMDEKWDLTLPSLSSKKGTFHPINSVVDEMIQIMMRLGYCVRLGPSIEKEYYNFEALNIPAFHPARDMQDTFFIQKGWVLRTHTSPIQIRSLESEPPPHRILGVGPVYRCDSDLSHLPHFHQIEGMCVDKKISMADLKGTISFFVKEFFGEGLQTRFRPSYFPFTEPSAEVDCTCPLCRGKGCSLCKHSGWIEIGGCGLMNPKVLIGSQVNYPLWQGFAFGFGIERMAIIKYGVEDIRLFPENDLRFLNLFT